MIIFLTIFATLSTVMIVISAADQQPLGVVGFMLLTITLSTIILNIS
jgi:hypothetical protein